MRVYRAVMPVVAAYLLDTHLNLDRSRPGEPREKPHTSRLCLHPPRKRIGSPLRDACEYAPSELDVVVVVVNRCLHRTQGTRAILFNLLRVRWP